jgi:hypothetical protein
MEEDARIKPESRRSRPCSGSPPLAATIVPEERLRAGADLLIERLEARQHEAIVAQCALKTDK